MNLHLNKFHKLLLFILYSIFLYYIKDVLIKINNRFIPNVQFFDSYVFYDGKRIQRDFYPKVSVIIPCYQKGRYLPRAFKSCIEDQHLSQYHINIEIIGIDDASSDNTTQIFTDLKKKYETENVFNTTNDQNVFKNNVNIKLFRFEKNKGALYTRIFAVNQSRADYLMSLDADDEFIPGIIPRLLSLINSRTDIDVIQFRLLCMSDITEKQHILLKKNNSNLTFTYGLFFYGWLGFNVTEKVTLNDSITKLKYQFDRSSFNQIQTDLNSIPNAHFINKTEIRKMLLIDRFMWNIPSIIIKREIMAKGIVALDFDPNYKKTSEYEDRLILYASYYFCENYYFLDEVGYIYHSGIYTPRRKPRLRYVNFLLSKLFSSGKKIV